MDKEKLSKLAEEFGLPEEMIASLLSKGLSEEAMRKACWEPDDEENTNEAAMKRWEKHKKKIYDATGGM